MANIDHNDHIVPQYEVRVFANGKWFESVYGTLRWCCNYIAEHVHYDFDYVKILLVG